MKWTGLAICTLLLFPCSAFPQIDEQILNDAEAGQPFAQFLVGGAYFGGKGVPQNYSEAEKWFRLAADQGSREAQVALGFMYANAKGFPENFAEALKWYRLAAIQGDVDAQANLGAMYDEGRGVPQDYVEAIAWYRQAAEQGHSGAQASLGVMYGQGKGVPQSYSEMYIWSSLAATGGRDSATVNRDLAAKNLTPEEIASAQKKAAKLFAEISIRKAAYEKEADKPYDQFKSKTSANN